MKFTSIQILISCVGFNANFALGNIASLVDQHSWEPPRLDYRDVLASVHQIEGNSITKIAESKIRDALITGDGVLSLTNVISQSEKESLYNAMVDCYSSSDSAKEVVYPDGTKRSTWAAPASGDLNACDELSQAAKPIRKKIGEVMNNLSLQIEAALVGLGHSPKFPKASSLESDDTYSLHELVSQGEQLDHLHVYRSNENSSKEVDQDKPLTIDWHTDYGFALAFLPGHVLMKDESSHPKYTPSKGFFIQMPDGSAKEVTFTEEDDVVVLLGDGAAHIKNAIGGDHEISFRAVPHSFVMPDKNDVLRMWVGRMMLFPADMIHTTTHESFGDIKDAMNNDPSYHLNNGRVGYTLGCSSPDVMSPRLLADETMNCTDDQFMCWHACFNNTEELSPTACESRNLQLACVSNVDGSLWDGETHSKEFEPACFAATELATEDTAGSGGDSVNSPIVDLVDDSVTEDTAGSDGDSSMGDGEESPPSNSVAPGNWYKILAVPVLIILNVLWH